MNPRNLYKRYIPQNQHFKDHQFLKHLGEWLHDPSLWHLNRRSAANAVAIGFFISFIPLPGQVFLAALAAVFARVNLPLTVTSVFLSNPLTMAPMFLIAYKVGASILEIPADQIHFVLSYEWLSQTLIHIWKPLLLGCFILGVFTAAMGRILVLLLWRLHLIRRWRSRRNQSLNK
jgi:hypothetical protein